MCGTNFVCPRSAAAQRKDGFGASVGACTEHPFCIRSLAQSHLLFAMASQSGGEVTGVSSGARCSTSARATSKCPCGRFKVKRRGED